MEMGLEKRLLMGAAWRVLIQRALVPRLLRFGQLSPRGRCCRDWFRGKGSRPRRCWTGFPAGG
jgi:hypothetical protein